MPLLLGVVCRAVDQNERPVAIHLEPLPVTVLVQYVFRDVVDGVLEHLRRCRVECRIHAPPLADRHLHLRDMGDPLIQHLDVLQILFNPRVRHAGGHEQERTLVETGHELLSQSRESIARGGPETGLPERLPADRLESLGHDAERLVETHPYHHTEQHRGDRQHHKLPPVVEAPAQDLFVIDHQRPQEP